jgi:hypothetical protein
MKRVVKLRVLLDVIDEEPYRTTVDGDFLAKYFVSLDKRSDELQAAADIEKHGEERGPVETEESQIFTILKIEDLEPQDRAGYL